VTQMVDLRLQTREALLKSGFSRFHVIPERDDTRVAASSQPRSAR
jgi:hypothetical protein